MRWQSKPGLKMPAYTKSMNKTIKSFKEVLLATLKLTTLHVFASTNSYFSKNVKYKQKHLRCKKEWPRTKRALLKKMWNQIGRPRPPAFDRIKNFDHHDLTAKHCYSGAQDLLMLMGSKFLIKMNALRPGHLYQKFWSHQHQETLSTWIIMFCSEVMMIEIFNPIKSRRPWPPNSISHLFQQGLFSSWPLLFYTWGAFV